MILDFELMKKFYASYGERVEKARKEICRPLTYAEKVLYAHLFRPSDLKPYQRGVDYVDFRPDRVAMQDATAQMALLQFMNAGKAKVAVPASVHCDHLIRADVGTAKDLPEACRTNKEVYDFLRSVSQKYHIGFWEPGAGIIHQVVLENYAFPGGMMVGTDSHTPNAGGLGMVAVGVGGADAVDVLTAQPWELKMPRLIGVHLTGQLSGWASPKDVILKILGILTVKGGTNSILEYFGDGVHSISATGRATICNMGAELGATCSLFPYDENTDEYLCQTGRESVAVLARQNRKDLLADDQVYARPDVFYDQILEIDLSSIEPYLNGPFTPDAATPLSQMKTKGPAHDFPMAVEVGLVGSCTNSSYEDLCRAASIARQAYEKQIPVKAQLIINPGSEQIRYTAERDGILDAFQKIGAVIMTNACGPCIGQWKRHTDDNNRKNSIVTSFNRNFRRRADGNPNTYAFIGSPELVTALAIAGRLDFDPAVDNLQDKEGHPVKLDAPTGFTFPPKGFEVKERGFLPPSEHPGAEVLIDPHSSRLQKLKPFAPWDGKDLEDMPLLIKTQGKCTTDHISMAGPWLKYRGHLQNISDNLLMGAVNAFNGECNQVKDQLTGAYVPVSTAAKDYKAHGISSIVVAEDNYGEGSSREHAAMEPRFLNVKVILAKSFARIHETNLKKQGMLALTFLNKDDYNKVQEDDRISLTGLKEFCPGSKLSVLLKHKDGIQEQFLVAHTYNETQIEWFKAGSALNNARKE
ncbi:MAG: aconitate hydratase [Prevotella sp.]|jgi:aconitate hydratase|nr:aconitate hydratase [Prevotella sp.]MCI2080399.1 aconitate hydratase [Prevotella sp.]MCI2102195.1 aconitate hydratase [Prevotella sp.]